MEEEMKQSKEIAEITTKLLQDWLNYIPTRTPDGNYNEYEQKGIQSYGFFYSRLPDLINKIIKIKDKEREEVIEGIRNDLYDLLPTGDLNAFDIIKTFTDYIKGLDKKDNYRTS